MARTRPEWTVEQVCILGKTYPTPSKKHVETVCTGGITADGRLMRLFPISYRLLSEDKQFKLFTWIKVRVTKSQSDLRAESMRIDPDSIECLKHISKPLDRLDIIRPGVCPSLEYLHDLAKADHNAKTIGLVRIRPGTFFWRVDRGDWTESQLAAMKSKNLFDENLKPLERIPYEFRLKYTCADNPECKGHDSKILAWEVIQAFRKFFRLSKTGDSEALEMLSQNFHERFFREDRDLYGLFGTMHRHPGTWILGGLMEMPMQGKPSLF